jgi:hypothetical protein
VHSHPCTFHRFFSRTRWSLLKLGHVLAAIVLELVPRDQRVFLVADDTVTRHRGKKVFGKGWHRDPINSSTNYIVKILGHKWVVLAVNVMLPCCKRPWALPVLACLYVVPPKLQSSGDGQLRRQSRAGKRKNARVRLARSKLPVLRKSNDAGVLEKRHKSPCLLARQMLAVMIHWFPDRRFILLGDGGFASHELALFCYRHRRHVTLVARFCGDASLYAMPSKRIRRKPGPRRAKGRRLPAPQKSVAAARKLRQAIVPWYSQSNRPVLMLSAAAGWYRCRGSCRGALVPIRWVYARETLKNDEGYFYSTDPTLTGEQIITWFAARWSIEVTFQEVRAHLGFHTPRQNLRQSVLRMAPCLLGLFSVVSVIYAKRSTHKTPKLQLASYEKSEPTFADALAATRWIIWDKILLPRLAGSTSALFPKTPCFIGFWR